MSDETMTKHGRVCCPHESTGLCRACLTTYPLPVAVNRMLKAENARLRERVAALEGALKNIVNVLGPAACSCDGQQAEVDTALHYAATALTQADETTGGGAG